MKGSDSMSLDRLKSGEAIWVLGFMSGTSMDGVDAALIQTDGERVLAFGPGLERPYTLEERAAIRAAMERAPSLPWGEGDETVELAALILTGAHLEAGRVLIQESGIEPALIGFHGQTIRHQPPHGDARGHTWQIGEPDSLADEFGVPVIWNLRGADMEAGGHGAPLAPAYHAALAHGLEKPLMVVNIGGVANVTFLPEHGEPFAFDCGPGNAPIDDWVRAGTGGAQLCDEDGMLAMAGTASERRVTAALSETYFALVGPKSLDRMAFTAAIAEGLSLEDGAATLTQLCAAGIAEGVGRCPAPPLRVLVTGGGRRNPAIMAALRRLLACPVEPVEVEGWRGGLLEAELFAYLAARSVRGLAYTWPSTTGVPAPTAGGDIVFPLEIGG